MSRRKVAGVLVAAGFMGVVVSSSRAVDYNEDYNFGPAYFSGFANKTFGPDMLPFTSDDGVAVNNHGGGLSLDVIDLNGDTGGLDINFAFYVRKTDDDQQLSLSAHSEFALGIIAEGEHWLDARDAAGNGATGGGPDGSSYAGKDWDWETNDAPGWESESNYFWFNNASANQRGLGGSRYYFEYKNPDQYPGVSIFDEPEKYRHSCRLRHTWGPTNPWGYTGNTNFGLDYNLEIRGLMVPISELATLEDGSLHPLFGWQSIDMAKYLREKIAPLFDGSGNPAAGLEIWDPGNGGYNGNSNPPPYKWVILYQMKDTVSLLTGTKEQQAASVYGMVDGVSGMRKTYIMFKGDSDSNLPIEINPPAEARSFAGGIANSWGRDDLKRNTSTDNQKYGNLKVGTTGGVGVGWTLASDPLATDTRSINLPAGTAAAEAWIELPTMPLPAKQLSPIKGVAEVNVVNGSPNDVHIALVSGTSAVASATFTQGGPATVGLGGSVAGGPVTGMTSSSTGSTNVEIATTQYTTLELWYDAEAGSVTLKVDGAEAATHSGESAGGTVDGLYIWTSSGDQLFIDTLAVQSGAFRCNTPAHDADGDGDVDLVDFGVLQACFNGPNRPHPTGTFPSCACFDTEPDFDVDLADFGEFQSCFNGPNRPAACLPT